MPKYSGIVNLKGKFGKLSFYERKGVKCVRRASGFTKEQLQNDPRLRRVREHNTEFGAQSMASKSLRTAFSPLRNFSDGTLHNRLMGIAARVTSLMLGKHGERPVAFSRVKPILDKLQLNADRTLESSLLLSIKPTPSAIRNSSRVKLDFDIPVAIKAPNGSTHFRLVHVLGVTSDIEYEPALGGFIPVAHQVDGLSARTQSDYISLEQQSASITFETTLPTTEIPANATVVEVLGIEFCQALGGIFAPFSQGKAAMVIGVF